MYCLKNLGQGCIFYTHVEERPDVARHFRELDVNSDYSGFVALVSARKIGDGEYAIGIYMRKSDIEAPVYTNKAITKSKGAIKTGFAGHLVARKSRRKERSGRGSRQQRNPEK